MSEIAGTSSEWSSRNFRRRDELVLAWSQWLEGVPWELFVTLTFDPKRVFPVDRNMASREAFWWCCETSRMHRSAIAWAYAPERGRTGLWHVHALLAGAPPRLPAACELWKVRNGHIDVRPVRDVRGASLYASKSAALTGEIVWSDTCRRYWSRCAVTDVALHPIEKPTNSVDFGTPAGG
jgi:hypothetical protein